MRSILRGLAGLRVAASLGSLGLVGCVPSAYVFEPPQVPHYGSGYGYYSPAHPGVYPYPGVYGYSNHYGPVRYPPTVVYIDRDHDRHVGHRGHDGKGPPSSSADPGQRPPPARRPTGLAALFQAAPPHKDPCSTGKKCEPSGEVADTEATDRVRQPRAPTRPGGARRSEGRTVPD